MLPLLCALQLPLELPDIQHAATLIGRHTVVCVALVDKLVTTGVVQHTAAYSMLLLAMIKMCTSQAAVTSCDSSLLYGSTP